MAEQPPKPFACTTEGCTMTFSNQDHLSVHQRKHEMVLHFGMKNSGLIADQTPTPTRFLQNCDEVGLFQDLQNVNPFDEPFRKAAEMVKSGSLPVPALPDDDTLHTPHIFPHLPEVTITMYKSASKLAASEKSSSVLTNRTPPVIMTEDDAQSMETSDETETDEPATKTNEHFTETNESVNETNEPATETNELLTKTDEPATKTTRAKYRKYTTQIVNSKLAAAKSKLQQVIQSKDIIKTKAQPIIVLPILHSAVQPILPKIEFYDCSGNKTVQQMKPGPTRKSNIDNVRDPIKLDTRARNRAAALRSRAKKRIFIDLLEERLNTVNKENCMLKNIITDLHKEVKRLNTLLLAHQDCPVTQALKMGENIPVGISIISDEMDTDTQIVVITEKTDFSQMNNEEKGEFSASPKEAECIINDNSILS